MVLDPQQTDNIPESQDKLTEAIAIHRQGDLESALRLYEKILRESPQNPDVLYLIGLVHQDRGDYVKAVDNISKALVFKPKDPAFLNQLGCALVGLKRIDAALSRFEDAILLQPDYANAHLNLGLAYTLKNDMRAALAPLNKTIQLEPKSSSAHQLMSLALKTLGCTILANYHEILARYFGNMATEAQANQTTHTFFLDKTKALHVAQQANRVIVTVAVTGLQMCYYLGVPFPNAPNNLIALPFDSEFVPFFISTRLACPTIVDFDPSSEPQCQLAYHIAVSLENAKTKRKLKTQERFDFCRQMHPELIHGQPLRVFIAASRFTTVMQYNSRDLAQGFKDNGCEVQFHIESDDRESLDIYHIIEKQIQFNPHLVVNINHLDNTLLHPDVFNVTWWEDPMPEITAGKQLPWRERDLVYSIDQELDFLLERCGAKDIMRQTFCCDQTIFRDEGNPRKQKIIFIGSSYRHVLGSYPEAHNLVSQLLEIFEAGEPLTDALLDDYAQKTIYDRNTILFRIWCSIVRDQSVHWLCEFSDDIEVEVYGRYWNEDPVVAPFYKGELPHGSAVASAYNAASHALVTHPFDLQSQRLAEVASCGTIPVVYDCRYRAEKPHWDNEFLWFRTKEDLRTCLSRTPQGDIAKFSKERSYASFAKRILTKIHEFLSSSNGS